jgi:TatD DNase family protein
MRFIDIGANLTDRMYSGEYNGSARHPPDLAAVVGRARAAGVERVMVTGGSLEESRAAVELAGRHQGLVWATVGCHPTRCGQFEAEGAEPAEYYEALLRLVRENRDRVAAIGEIGLDYDRTNFCDAETQRKYFGLQLELAAATELPLFLHCRAAAPDLVETLAARRHQVTNTCPAARCANHSNDP